MRKFCVLKCLFILELRTTFQLPVVSLSSVAVVYNCRSVCLLPQKLVKVNGRLFTKLTGCWNYLLTRCKLRNKFCFCGGNVTCRWNCFVLFFCDIFLIMFYIHLKCGSMIFHKQRNQPTKYLHLGITWVNFYDPNRDWN